MLSVVWMDSSRLTLSRGEIPDLDFTDEHFPERKIPPLDYSPNEDFPNRTIFHWEISLTEHLIS